MRRLVILLLALAAACTSSSEAPIAEVPVAVEETERDTITVPLSLHVMVEQGAPGSDLSSTRTQQELQTIATATGEIWEPMTRVLTKLTTPHAAPALLSRTLLRS